MRGPGRPLAVALGDRPGARRSRVPRVNDVVASRNEAAALASELPGILLEARRLAAAAPGVHGRRRAGPGEAFWQFRDHRPEDGARLVDWRRSARGERLYVREREREAAQTALFWVDPAPGFAWASGPTTPTKRRRAMALSLAFAILLARGGERVGALGGPMPRAGARAAERLGVDLILAAHAVPPHPVGRSVLVYCSDFYLPIETWATRLKAAAAPGASGALIMIGDPAEEDFPFRGRTRFEEPGGKRDVLFGRAEAARDAYSLRLAAHRAALRETARIFGFILISHRTDHSAAPALSLLAASLDRKSVV
jgi:uncharacterized protein (DUF58 family)